METVMDILVLAAIAVAGVLFRLYAVPWLRERGIYAEVVRMVKAAEKWEQTHEIDKKAWVCNALREAGVEVTPQIERWIEAAVMELDIAVGALGEKEKE